MKINPISTGQQIYSPINIRRQQATESVEDAQKVEENQKIQKNHLLNTVNNLSSAEKNYFINAYESNEQVQMYLKSGHLHEQNLKGQIIDIRG